MPFLSPNSVDSTEGKITTQKLLHQSTFHLNVYFITKYNVSLFTLLLQVHVRHFKEDLLIWAP